MHFVPELTVYHFCMDLSIRCNSWKGQWSIFECCAINEKLYYMYLNIVFLLNVMEAILFWTFVLNLLFLLLLLAHLD